MNNMDLYWLAGWLEGEGSFMKGPPCRPHLPIVVATSTDVDVVERAANLLHVSCCAVKRRKKWKPQWKDVWQVRLQGKKAADLMRKIRPLMGGRRKKQIDVAMASYHNGLYKLDDEKVREIKFVLREGKMKHGDIAQKFGLCRETVVRINKGKRWGHVVV